MYDVLSRILNYLVRLQCILIANRLNDAFDYCNKSSNNDKQVKLSYNNKVKLLKEFTARGRRATPGSNAKGILMPVPVLTLPRFSDRDFLFFTMGLLWGHINCRRLCRQKLPLRVSLIDFLAIFETCLYNLFLCQCKSIQISIYIFYIKISI